MGVTLQKCPYNSAIRSLSHIVKTHSTLSLFLHDCCHKTVIMKCIIHGTPFCYLIMSGILKRIDLNAV